MIHQTSPEGRARIEQFEGLRLHAYQDIRGVWTIGFGHTGPDVHPGLQWTREQADDALTRRLAEEFDPAVNEVSGDVPTTQGQFDAMVCLAYNIGVAGFQSSEVAKWHRAHEYDKAADAFEHWDHVSGRVNEALHERRVEEAQVYMDASPPRYAQDAPGEPITVAAYRDTSPPDTGHQKAVVATLTGPSVGVLGWWANTRHGLGIPEHVLADMVGIVAGSLVWIVPSQGGWGRWKR